MTQDTPVSHSPYSRSLTIFTPTFDLTPVLTLLPTPPTPPHSSPQSCTQPIPVPTHTLFSAAFFVLLALAIYTGVTVSFLGRRFGDWRFSWSYILGWVALLMTFFAGTEVWE